MRYVAIEKAKDNMVLAMPIYDSINRVLLATGTITVSYTHLTLPTILLV